MPRMFMVHAMRGANAGFDRMAVPHRAMMRPMAAAPVMFNSRMKSLNKLTFAKKEKKQLKSTKFARISLNLGFGPIQELDILYLTSIIHLNIQICINKITTNSKRVEH